METEDKSYWGARILALLIVSVTIAAIVTFSPENFQRFKKRIEIKANENTGEIISAVENLGRKDISIDIKDEWWGYESTRFFRFIWTFVGLFFSFGFLLGIYYLVYCLCKVLLKKKTTEILNA